MNKDIAYWSILTIVVVIAGSGLYYYYQNTRPCTHPISYAIGAVDTRFNISKATLLAEAKAAAAIWNSAEGLTRGATTEGKKVLVYDPNAAMKINLVYDSREANAKLGSQIASQQAALDSARVALDASQAQFASQQVSYNQAVDAVNARGATPSEAAALNAERASLNALANSINTGVADFNASVAALNAVVKQYNQTAGHAFEEGQFVRDATGERINIFEFVGATQLERVLAHEFGHAIGLDHNTDPKSIMYAQNESGNLVLTSADLAALNAVCGS